MLAHGVRNTAAQIANGSVVSQLSIALVERTEDGGASGNQSIDQKHSH